MTKRHTAQDPDPVRRNAIRRLQQKRGVQAHVLVYVIANVIQIAVWWTYTPDQHFWPIWSILGWGIGLFFHIWAVYSGSKLDEAHISREVDRIQRTGPAEN